MANDFSFKINKPAVFDDNSFLDEDSLLDEYIHYSEKTEQNEEPQNDLEESKNTKFFSDVAAPSQDTFGDKTHNVTRKEIIKLFHKVEDSNRSDEKELLGILQDALKENKSNHKTEAWNHYQQVAGVFEETKISENLNEDEESIFGNSETTELPQPSSIETSALGGKKYIYDNLKMSDYEFDADFKSPAKEFEITSNNGKIKINGISSKDTMVAQKISEAVYEIKVCKNGSSNMEDTLTYRIIGNPSKIILNTLPQNISGVDELDSIIQAGSKPSKTSWPISADKIKTLVPSGGDGSTQAQTLLQKITDAIHDGSNEKWTAAMNYLDSLWPSDKHFDGSYYDAGKNKDGSPKNPDGMSQTHGPLGVVAVRKVLTAIYAYAGNNQEKFKALMTKISPELRLEMSNCLQWAINYHENSFTSSHKGTPNPDYVPPNPNYEYQKNQAGVKEPTPDKPQYVNIPNPKNYVGKTGNQDGDQWNNEAALKQLNDIPHLQTENVDSNTDNSDLE